jgi:DNA-binding PucR family transcriptional regulator
VSSAPLQVAGREPARDVSPDHLERLLGASAAINAAPDLAATCAAVARAARTLVGADAGALLLLDGSGRRLQVAALDGYDPAAARELAAILGDQLAATRASAWAAADGVQRPVLHPAREGAAPFAALVAVRDGGTTIGVLATETHEQRPSGTGDAMLLQVLADHAGAAIVRARLHADDRARTRKLRLLVREVDGMSRLAESARAAREQLLAAALGGGGVAALATALCRILDRPIVVISPFGVPLSYAAPDGCDASLPAALAGAELRDRLARVCEELTPAETRRLTGSAAAHLLPVMAGGEQWGLIGVVDEAPLTPDERSVLDQACSILAVEMFRERSVAAIEARLQGSLLSGLLLGDEPGPGMQEQAARMGFDLDAAHCLVSARAADGLELAVVSAAGARAAARCGLRSLFGSIEGTAVCLLAPGDRALTTESVEAWIADFRREAESRTPCAGLAFGVSRVACDRTALRSAFAQASQALAVGRLGGGREITHFGDVELLATLVDVTNHEQLERYVRHAIGALLDYDEQRNSDLAGTLEAYLDCSGVARHAAKVLYLHPHSLRYRLRRITEIQGLRLDDPMVRLSAHLALKLRPLLQARPART